MWTEGSWYTLLMRIENVNYSSQYGGSTTQKTKKRATIQLSCSTSGYLPTELQVNISQRHLHFINIYQVTKAKLQNQLVSTE